MATASSLVQIGGHRSGFAATARDDRWWVGPFLTFLGLTTFIVYATWAGIQGNHYFYGSYLSPFYSPVLWAKSGVAGGVPVGHAWFGEWPAWWPSWLPASPTFLIIAFPLSFRFTCYYYRKAYYRAFAMTPPACAVNALPRKGYRGETFILIFQNLHRYAMYAALVFNVILAYDAVLSFFREGRPGIGVGSVVLTLNAILLGLYSFSCHSFRHLIGGSLNQYSKNVFTKLRHALWERVSAANERHMLFAWTSLFWVGFSDVYIRLVSMGVWHDLSTWGAS